MYEEKFNYFPIHLICNKLVVFIVICSFLILTGVLVIVGIPYEVTIWTSDKARAGTDANVFVQMYGTEGKTDEIVLNNRSDNFERGMKEKFKVNKELLISRVTDFYYSFILQCL